MKRVNSVLSQKAQLQSHDFPFTVTADLLMTELPVPIAVTKHGLCLLSKTADHALEVDATFLQ